MTIVRLLDNEGRATKAKVNRLTKTRVYLTAIEGLPLSHICNRVSGKPYGPQQSLSIHPDDLALLADLSSSPAPKNDPRRSVGTPGHWDV